MKITFFIGSIGGGGAERVSCNLANYLTEKHQVTIVTMVEAKHPYPLNSTVRHHVLLKDKDRKNVFHNSYVKWRELKKYIQQNQEDVYVVMLNWAILLLLHFRRIIKAPIICSERANPYIYSRLQKFLLRLRADKADAWVFQTKDAQSWYLRFMKHAKRVIIPNAINEEFIGKQYEGERKKMIVAAGRMKQQKNFALLIRAFAKIADEFPAYSLKIFGEGHLLEQNKNLAQELGVGNRVIFPGHVSNIGEQIQDASMYVLASNYEGMPNALMEAMALGLPCVSTDCPSGGPAFLIEHGKNGLLVPVNDEKAMAAAIKTILSDEKRAREMGDEAHKICETLAPEKIYGRWETFILSVINGGGGVTP